MKSFYSRAFCYIALCAAVVLNLLLGASPVRAGLTVNIHLYHDEYGYFFYPWLGTNDTPPAVTGGAYRIQSPQQPTNGTWMLYQSAGGNFSQLDGAAERQYSFDSHLDAVTNGLWSIWVTNSTSTNEFKFAVTASGFTSNSFGASAQILFPQDGELNVANQPTFSWSGPTNWAGSLYVQDDFIDEFGDSYYENGASLPPGNTAWYYPQFLPEGTNEFRVSYHSNATSIIIASIPTNNSGQALTGWISTAALDTFDSTRFVALAGNDFDQFLVARYNFEDIEQPGLDSSGNGNHPDCGSFSGPLASTNSTDAAVGIYSHEFFGDSAICITTNTPSYANLSNALAESFTVTAWIKTTSSFVWEGDEAQFGSGIFYPYTSDTNSVAPLSMTGGKVAFTIKDDQSTPTTIRSTSNINDGSFHFVAVTRNRITGMIKLYVDGQLQASDVGPTMPVICHSTAINIGKGDYEDFIGLVDDLRIYSAELSEQDLGILFGNPGGSGIAAHYDFDGFDSYPQDVSGNGNHMDYGFGLNGGYYQRYTETIAGSGSMQFYKDFEDSNSGAILGWNPMPAALMDMLAGSFSISLWVKTSNETGTPGQNAADGACIVVADVPGSARDLTPIALTGGKVAFTTGGDQGDDTLTSDAYVSDDSWHHIVVTRNQQTGEKRLYIDGQEDIGSPTTGSTDLLDAPNFLSIGMRLDASASDADSASAFSSTGYEGLLDDLQFYDRAITPDDVLFLFNNPGEELPGGNNTLTLAQALDTDVLGLFTFTMGGDAPWLPQTDVTSDSVDAAASGTIGDNQASWFETVTPVNGDISFQWKVSSAFGDYVGFFINGVQWDNIWGDVDWQSSSHSVSAGDVLRWEYYKNGSDSEGNDKAWVDQITFEPELVAPGLILTLEINREVAVDGIERYLAWAGVDWLHPTPLTTNRLSSPNGGITATRTWNIVGSGSGATWYYSLDALLNECTNGLWTLVINKGHPLLEDTYTFSVTITNLTTNTLSRVTILNPASGAGNVPTNSTFHWSGPTNFSTLAVKKFMPPFGANEVHTFLAPTLTNWPSPPALLPGTNVFNVRYDSNNFPHAIFTTPVNTNAQTADYWSTGVKLVTSTSVEFEVVVPPAPAQITGVQRTGGNLQFAFTTQDGRTHTIEARTNLTAGSWIELTNFTGDGNLQQFTFTTTNPPIRYFRVKTE